MADVVAVQFITSLPEPYNKPIEQLSIPINSSILDLSDMVSQLLELNNTESFDFSIDNIFIQRDLQSHIQQHNVNTEKTLQLFYSLALKKPEYLDEAKVDDWISQICTSKRFISVPGQELNEEQKKNAATLICSSYDGSIVYVNAVKKQENDQQINDIQKTRQIHLSKQPLTQVSLWDNNTLFTGGYDGRLIHLNIDSGRVIQEFRSADSQIPIKQILPLKFNQKTVVSTLCDDDTIRLYDIQNSSESNESYKKDSENDNQIVRGPKNDQIMHKFSFDFQVHAFQQLTYNELILSASHSIQLFDIYSEQPVRSFIASAPAKAFLVRGSTFLSGQLDRAVRLYDIRCANPVVRTYKGHKSHVVSLRSNEGFNFLSCEVAGRAFIWDLRADIPYHVINCYDSTMDRRNDQARVLDLEWNQLGYFPAGSARKIFWFQ